MKYLLAIVLAIALVACNKNEADKQPQDNLPNVNEAPSKNLSDKVKELEEQVQNLEFDKLIRQIEKIALLKIGGDGYSTIAFDLGVLAIKVTDIKPYANSSKVELEIGNPLGATITGLKATIQWGSTDEKGFVLEELGSKEITIEKNIVAGSWNKVNVTLDSIEPKKLGFLRIKNISHTGIILKKAN